MKRGFPVKMCRVCRDALGEYRPDLGEWLCDPCDLKEYEAKMEDLGVYPRKEATNETGRD